MDTRSNERARRADGTGGRRLGTRGRATSVVAGAVLLLASLAGPAQAGIHSSGSWDDSGTDSGVCGRYDIEWRDWGSWQIEDATAKTDYQFFYFSNEWNFATVIRNPDTGAWFTEAGSGTYGERHARPIGDDVFAFNTMERGTYVVRDAAGKVRFRDQGLVLLAWQFDTEGDSQPGGWTVDGYPIELAFTWSTRFDFCALADRLIG